MKLELFWKIWQGWLPSSNFQMKFCISDPQCPKISHLCPTELSMPRRFLAVGRPVVTGKERCMEYCLAVLSIHVLPCTEMAAWEGIKKPAISTFTNPWWAHHSGVAMGSLGSLMTQEDNGPRDPHAGASCPLPTLMSPTSFLLPCREFWGSMR